MPRIGLKVYLRGSPKYVEDLRKLVEHAGATLVDSIETETRLVSCLSSFELILLHVYETQLLF